MSSHNPYARLYLLEQERREKMIELLNADAAHIPLADGSVHMCVTSPPYWGLRKYAGDMAQVWGGEAGCEHEWGGETKTLAGRNDSGEKRPGFHGMAAGYGGKREVSQGQFCLHCNAWFGEHGLEPTPEQYVANIVMIFREVRRVLRDDGTLWLNLGDSYNGSGGAGGDYNAGGLKEGQPRYPGRDVGSLKPKDLCGIPWRVAFALQADGWWLRSDIIWAKPNPMPESVTDRPTKAHEYLFLLSKSARYYYDADAVKEPLISSPETYLGAGKSVRENHQYGSVAGRPLGDKSFATLPSGRNRRTVWNIATMPYSGATQTAHFRRVAVDDVSDGMMHIALPDCQYHGEQFVRIAREFHGGHEADYWSRIHDIDAHLYSERHPDSWLLNNDRLASMRDSQARMYSRSAIDHNNQIHKMALALDSTPAYMPFFEMMIHTADKRALLSLFVQHLCIYGNNILADEWDANLSTRIPHRIVDTQTVLDLQACDTSRCTCLFYEYYTRNTDHFATYPPALVEPCIKAGTSERGVCAECAECAAPWQRVVKATGGLIGKKGGWHPHDRTVGDHLVADKEGGWPEWRDYNRLTTGWRPTCEHDAEPIPATVFDPFAGSGTTLMVARQLGRSAVGLDLSFPYLRDQARKRLELDALDAWGQGINGDGDVSDLPLFAETA